MPLNIGEEKMTEKEDWLDLGAGLGLLVPEYADRMMAAMKRYEGGGLPDDLEHVIALAIIYFTAKNKNKINPFIIERWGSLSKRYHENQCPVCSVSRTRGDEPN